MWPCPGARSADTRAAASSRARRATRLIDGLEDAFVACGGVPQELLFGQMKAVITRDWRVEGGALVRNASARTWRRTSNVSVDVEPNDAKLLIGLGPFRSHG